MSTYGEHRERQMKDVQEKQCASPEWRSSVPDLPTLSMNHEATHTKYKTPEGGKKLDEHVNHSMVSCLLLTISQEYRSKRWRLLCSEATQFHSSRDRDPSGDDETEVRHDQTGAGDDGYYGA